RARTGVAWLSFHSNAQVLPMGFGGMRGALQAIFQFKRPRISMNVGTLMPPVSGSVVGKSRKEALEDAANAIMAEVQALIPAEEKRDWNQIQDEQFDFEGFINGHDGSAQAVPVQHAAGLGRFFHTPVILDVMDRNMNLPVQALRQLDHDPQAVADAAEAALSFLDSHPQFLSYRFGYHEASEIYAGVVELRDLAQRTAAEGHTLTLKPIRTYRRSDSGAEIVETTLDSMHQM
ncbi:MAG: hypothetical protein K8J31_30425, partial [Anaerolineae bacterium]|nr:hypothetical protein [Anaerolineae bacterium]